MTLDQIIEEIKRLPRDQQQKIADFALTLKFDPSHQSTGGNDEPVSFFNDTFFGIWRDRPEITDGVDWVRRFRASEWPD